MSGTFQSRFDLALQLFGEYRPAGKSPSAVIAIPARDERETIESCLSALADQAGAADFGIVVLANNCRDTTVPRAREKLGAAGIPHLVLPIELETPLANAGFARGLGLSHAR